MGPGLSGYQRITRARPRGPLWLLAVAVALATPALADPQPPDATPASPAPHLEAAPATPSHTADRRTLLHPAAQDAPRPLTAGRTPATSGGFTRTVLSLGVVLGLIWLCAVAFKRFIAPRLGLAASLGAAGRSPAGLLEILGRYPVGSGSTLVLLKLDRRILLLSQQRSGRVGLRSGAAGFAPLCEVTDPDEVASILAKARDAEGESISARFRTLLTSFEAAPGDQHAPARTTDAPQPPSITPALPRSGAAESLRTRLAAMRTGEARA